MEDFNLKKYIKENPLTEADYVDPLTQTTFSEDEMQARINMYKTSSMSRKNRAAWKAFFKRVGIKPSQLKTTTPWTDEYLPEIKSVLSKIDAPLEWKKAVIKYEKTLYSAKQLLYRTNNVQAAYEYTDFLHELPTGNTAFEIGDEKGTHEYFPYWKQYMQLMYGDDSKYPELTIDDALA